MGTVLIRITGISSRWVFIASRIGQLQTYSGSAAWTTKQRTWQRICNLWKHFPRQLHTLGMAERLLHLFLSSPPKPQARIRTHQSLDKTEISELITNTRRGMSSNKLYS